VPIRQELEAAQATLSKPWDILATMDHPLNHHFLT